MMKRVRSSRSDNDKIIRLKSPKPIRELLKQMLKQQYEKESQQYVETLYKLWTPAEHRKI